VDALSSGWRQRLALGLAFIGEPRLVLLDEPFNWLDPVAAYNVKDRLTALAADRLVITALHDVSTFALRCDHGVLLQDGRVSARFGPSDLAAARADLSGFERGVYEALRGSAT
jgi:ABC-type multidrug transport system ATPase subunit